jgi:hypothetical protein
MKTQATLGSLISLMLTLAAQVRHASNVPNHSRAKVVVRLLVFRFIARSLWRQHEEDARLSCMVFRFSSSNQSATPSQGY